MSKFNEIKAGYRITVTSWENDADNYNTKSVEGFSANDVLFLKPLFALFKSKNSWDNPGIGNIYDPNDCERAIVANAVKSAVTDNIHLTTDPNWKSALDECTEEDDGPLLDYFTEFFYDFGLTSGEFYTRVLDKLTIEYIPETIRIEDVTDQF